MATVDQLEQARQKAQAAGNAADVEEITGLIHQKRQDEYRKGAGLAGALGQAAVKGITGIGDLFASGAQFEGMGYLSPEDQIKYSEELKSGSMDNPFSKAAVSAGLTYEDLKDLPPSYRPAAAGVETFTGSMLPGAAMLKPLQGIRGAPRIIQGIADFAKARPLGFLGAEAASAAGAGQMAAGAEFLAPGNEPVRAGAEAIGGFAGPMSLMGGAYRGIRGATQKGIGALTGFKPASGKAVQNAIDELDTITKHLSGRVRGDAPALKRVLIGLQKGKLSPETAALYKSITDFDDPAKGIGAILEGKTPDTTYGKIVLAARRGSKTAIPELAASTIGHVWDKSLKPDGAVSFIKLKQGLFGGRNSVSSIMLKHGAIGHTDMNSIQELVEQGAKLEKFLGPGEALDLSKDVGNFITRYLGARAGSHLAKMTGAGGTIQIPAYAAKLATQMAKVPKLPNIQNAQQAQVAAKKLRGFLVQSLATLTKDEEE